MTSYDRDELTRPGHAPALTTTPPMGSYSSCSCGWIASEIGTMTVAVAELNLHISRVDAGSVQ